MWITDLTLENKSVCTWSQGINAMYILSLFDTFDFHTKEGLNHAFYSEKAKIKLPISIENKYSLYCGWRGSLLVLSCRSQLKARQSLWGHQLTLLLLTICHLFAVEEACFYRYTGGKGENVSDRRCAHPSLSLCFTLCCFDTMKQVNLRICVCQSCLYVHTETGQCFCEVQLNNRMHYTALTHAPTSYIYVKQNY